MKAQQLRIARVCKRVLDTTLIILFAPFILLASAVTAVVVALTMGRPVLFTQERIGRNERPFTLLKFRTMSDRRNADGALLPDRERLTPAGRLLRKLSLDELPQFINVLRGDMSIVGPRPLPPDYLAHYRGRERNRHLVRPGLTGLAQVSGRNHLAWDDRLALDADYVERVGLLLDLRILVATVATVIRGSDVSPVANDWGERLDVLRSYPTADGLALRRFEFSDIPTRVRLFRDPRVRRFMNLPSGVTEQSTEAWLRASRLDTTRRDFTVYEVDSGQPVSFLGIRGASSPDVPEIYVLVDPALHGHGHGTTALNLMLTWMRLQPDYRGCRLSVRQDDDRAVALFQRAGFGVVREQVEANCFEMQRLWVDDDRSGH
ncbi:MAG: GNAT family N-acetyltransferase [Brooklawnia sp.]|jgi:lipopolysaccharide/colanic/teichoic acid biosynthesis glycosyltransferase/RimJ/RimL family protein N-acetyltransferase